MKTTFGILSALAVSALIGTSALASGSNSPFAGLASDVGTNHIVRTPNSGAPNPPPPANSGAPSNSPGPIIPADAGK